MKCVAWTIALTSLTVRDAGAVWFSLLQEPGSAAEWTLVHTVVEWWGRSNSVRGGADSTPWPLVIKKEQKIGAGKGIGNA